MINGYEFLSEMDELSLYNSSESSRSIGLDRKTFSLRGKRLGLGQERELTEGVTSPRLYYSVDDCIRILGLGDTPSIRKMVRTNLIEGTSNSLVETTVQTHHPKPTKKSNKIDYQQIRKSIGDTGWRRKMRDYGVMTLDEVKSVFGLTPEHISKFQRYGGFQTKNDGKNILVEVRDIIHTLDNLFDELNVNYSDQLKTPIPMTEGMSFSNSVIQVGQFIHNENYRKNVLELLENIERKSHRISGVRR